MISMPLIILYLTNLQQAAKSYFHSFIHHHPSIHCSKAATTSPLPNLTTHLIFFHHLLREDLVKLLIKLPF